MTTRGSATAAPTGPGARWCRPGMALKAWVSSRAPASKARAARSASASVWPTATVIPRGGELLDRGQRAGQLGRHGDHAQRAAGRRHEPSQGIGDGCAQVLRRVRAAPGCGQERTLQVGAQQAGVARREVGDAGQAPLELLDRCGDQAHERAGGAVPAVQRERATDGVGTVVDGRPSPAVHVQVDEARRQPCAADVDEHRRPTAGCPSRSRRSGRRRAAPRRRRRCRRRRACDRAPGSSDRPVVRRRPAGPPPPRGRWPGRRRGRRGTAPASGARRRACRARRRRRPAAAARGTRPTVRCRGCGRRRGRRRRRVAPDPVEHLGDRWAAVPDGHHVGQEAVLREGVGEAPAGVADRHVDLGAQLHDDGGPGQRAYVAADRARRGLPAGRRPRTGGAGAAAAAAHAGRSPGPAASTIRGSDSAPARTAAATAARTSPHRSSPSSRRAAAGPPRRRGRAPPHRRCRVRRARRPCPARR